MYRSDRRRADGTTVERWIAQVSVSGRYRRASSATEAGAKRALKAMVRVLDDGVAIADGTTTVGDVLDRWAERDLAGRDMTRATLTKYEWAINALRTQLGRVRLRDLDVDIVESALDVIATGRHGRGKPLSRESMVAVRNTLAVALDFAQRRKLIGHNPARLAIVGPSNATPQTRRALDTVEGEAFWAALDDERLAPLFRVMLTTGLRAECHGDPRDTAS